MSAIHKRLHYSQKVEFRLLAATFSEYLPEEYPFEVTGGERIVKVSDFSEQIDVLPHSDPNIFSMAQRVMMAQTQLQLATSAPQIHNLHEAYFRMYQALGVQDISDILPPNEPKNSKDPATENGFSCWSSFKSLYTSRPSSAHSNAYGVYAESYL